MPDGRSPVPKFDDTPQWKREQQWDPIAQKMVKPDRPPTRKQIDYHRGLCERLGVEYGRPRTRREAQSAIDKLVSSSRGARACVSGYTRGGGGRGRPEGAEKIRYCSNYRGRRPEDERCGSRKLALSAAHRVIDPLVGELVGIGVLGPGNASERRGREGVEQLAHTLNKRT